MPLSAVSNFVDAHAYEAALRGASTEFLISEKGDFRAELTLIDLPRLRIRCGRESLSRISHVRAPAGRGLLYFMFEAGQPAMHVGGRALSAGEIVVCAPGSTQHGWTSAPCGWGSISYSTVE